MLDRFYLAGIGRLYCASKAASFLDLIFPSFLLNRCS